MNFRLCNSFEFNKTGSCNADNYILVNRRNNTTVATAETDVKNRKLYRSTACRQIVSPHQLFSVCADCTSLKRKKTISMSRNKQQNTNSKNTNLKYMTKEELIGKFKDEKKKRKQLERKIDGIRKK